MVNVENLFLLKESSDRKKDVSEYTNLLKEFEIDGTLEPIEIRNKVIEVFESNKELLNEDLEDLTTELMNLMKNFESSTKRFKKATKYKNAGRNARLVLNSIVNIKTEWNRKSMLLGV